MNILITMPAGSQRDVYFPPRVLDRLAALGTVTLNPHPRQFTREELLDALADTDVVMTHWGSASFDASVLDRAPRLRLLAHCAGTVARIGTPACFDRGIPILSANPVMARYVAEGALGCILAGLRNMLPHDAGMRRGEWPFRREKIRSLLDSRVGMVGLGAVGRNLLDLLRPFGVPVYVYDPYIPSDALDAWDFARPASFAEAMACQVVTVHASQTPETYHMVDAGALATMPDNALLVNTARGSLVDTEALIAELQSGRIDAVLDVYDRENCPQDSRLLACTENTLLQPHVIGAPVGVRMTDAIVDDLERFARGEPMRLVVSREQYDHMTYE